MKKALCLVAVLLACTGCSIRQAAYNQAANALAPWPDGKSLKPPKEGTKDPMTAVTGDNDPELVASFFPVALKTYEMMLFADPDHEGLGLMTGQLYIMYAAAFVQTPAEQIPGDEFDRQNAEYARAQNLYVRGRDYVLAALDHRFRNFSPAVFGRDGDARTAMLLKCKKSDAPALYWAAAGGLAAFSLSPLETKYLETLPGALAMLERASVLDPSFNGGAIWEALTAFYAAAPDTLGGGKDKAERAYEKALEYSKGKRASVHILYAKSFCIPAQDGAGFDEAIAKALAIDPEEDPGNRLSSTISRNQALWLRSHKADFILE